MPSDRWMWDATSTLEALGAADAALRPLSLPQARAYAEDILRVQEPGTEVAVRMRMRGAGISIWRGVWLEEGVRAAGVVAPETGFATWAQALLPALLARRSSIPRAREQLQVPGHYEVIVADLDRLRRLNEALGHERADLVLAARGSRLAAAFPPDAML